MILLILQVIFWIFIFLILHTYIFFPRILELFAINKKQNQFIWDLTDPDLPHVDILLAVYNEEKVIRKKIQSIFETNYPLSKIHLYIGSDASTDATDSIIRELAQQYPGIDLAIYSRMGKSGIVNALYRKTSSPIIILTDANVYFELDTIYHLVKHYKNEEIGVVGGNIVNPDFKHTGISFQEKKYLERENRIKYLEGISMGAMIGAFGGCYSIRRNLYVEIPLQSLVMDDFYIGMEVLRQGKKAINELSAICTEDVSNKLSEEFRRKVRISAGNFQNLFYFLDLLSPLRPGIAFCFISHKVIRWITPFLLIALFIMNLFLVHQGYIYVLSLVAQIMLMLSLLIDALFKKMNIHIKLLRFITHFYSMNLALLVGFVKYSRGIKTFVWAPTERNQ